MSLKRPTSRRKSSQDGITLNLVPILDAMVTLIAFLLFSMAIFAVVTIETEFPQVSSMYEKPPKQKPLQLTLSFDKNTVEIWSAFNLIKATKIPNEKQGEPNFLAIHEALVNIKQQFPYEDRIVLSPFGGASYDVLISLMDTVRILEKTDPPIFAKNKETGMDEPQKMLFPQIVFGNLLGGGS